MPDYSLTEKAKEDLIAIADYGDKHFGVKRSNQYRKELGAHLLDMANHPLHYQEVADIRKGYRRSVYGKFTIYYRIVGDDIEVVRILRGQDPTAALSER